MKYGYARVSTTKQDLTSQIEKLKSENCEKIYTDKLSGRNNNRPEFNKLLNQLQPQDILVVTKLDRLARSTQEALKIIEKLFHENIDIHILNLGRIEDTPTGRLIFTVFSPFADFERDLIVERTKEGKEIAKQSPNFKDGRPPKYSQQQIAHALNLLETHSYNQVAKMTGISKSTLLRYKNSK
ncbi:recombinase family protein [Enterococcus sp. DIV0872a]|uniref:recombinase family protein n=1 Tax=Enterococcus sp. DIV0872a TaxID=2774857 RepID=UPI003F20383C